MNNIHSKLIKINIFYKDRLKGYRYLRVPQKFSILFGRWMVHDEDVQKALSMNFPTLMKSPDYSLELNQ